MLDALIVTAPFTYTFGPSLAPALLKACVAQQGIVARTWDLSAEFNKDHSTHRHYKDVITWFQYPEVAPTKEAFEWYQSIVINYAHQTINQNTKCLAVSLLTQNSQRFTEDLCFHVKRIKPELKIILGGNGLDTIQFQFKKSWANLMIDSLLADCVIIGEGETALAYVLKNACTGIYTQTQLSNSELTKIPTPDYDDYDFSIYPVSQKTQWSTHLDARDINSGPIFSITSSKGCIKNCSFCDVSKIWNKFRHRTGASVANEMLELHKKYNARFFSFTDSLLNGGLKPFNEMNEAIINSGNTNIQYEGQMICRSNSDMPERYFYNMSKAGCTSVFIGIESGSEKVRADMGKGSTNADIDYSTEMFNKYGIKQSWNIIAGYPTETEQDWKATIDLINKWYTKSDGLLTVMPISPFLLLPGTPIADSDTYNHYEIEQEVINGYSDFAWVSGLNPSNNFKVRAERYLELCELVTSLSRDQTFIQQIEDKIYTTKKQLDWYNDNKRKKVFSIVNA